MSGPRRTPPKVPRPERAPLAASPLLAALEDAGADAVARFWAARPVMPLVEPVLGRGDERFVTFVLEEPDAEQVLLFVNRLTDERHLADSLMRRIPGTPLWRLTYRLGTTWRASYSFLVHERGQAPPWADENDQVAPRTVVTCGCICRPVTAPRAWGTGR